MAIIAVIEVGDGLLRDFELFGNEEEALKRGQEMWLEHEQPGESEMMDDPGFDEEWGGVSRGYRMHWFNDDHDVWVLTPGPGDMSEWRLLSPEMFNAIGHHMMDAAAEEVAMAQEESVEEAAEL